MSGNGKGLAAAIALVERQKLFEPTDRLKILHARDGLLARGEPFSRAEAKLLDLAERLDLRPTASDPEPHLTQYDEAIAEAAAARAAAELVAERAKDQWFLAIAARRKAEAEGKPAPERLLRRVDAAHEEYRAAAAACERAMVQFVDAQLARQHAKAAAVLAK